MINFEVYQSTTLEDLGTLAVVAGKKSTLSFIGKNLKNEEKRVVVLMNRADGTSAVVSCSKSVSDGVRKALADETPKNKILAALTKLSVLEGETGAFICAPQGANGTEETFTVEQLAIVKADYESVIAF